MVNVSTAKSSMVLPCCYLAPVSHYSAYYRAEEVRLEVCDHFAKQDSRIRVIHQANRGLSAARNAGLDIATSDYIQFVDRWYVARFNIYGYRLCNFSYEQ